MDFMTNDGLADFSVKDTLRLMMRFNWGTQEPHSVPHFKLIFKPSNWTLSSPGLDMSHSSIVPETVIEGSANFKTCPPLEDSKQKEFI